MLRIYFLQQWFNLSDPAVEEALLPPQERKLGSGSERTSQEGRAEPSSAAHNSQDVEKRG
jgi:hypothetical protein